MSATKDRTLEAIETEADGIRRRADAKPERRLGLAEPSLRPDGKRSQGKGVREASEVGSVQCQMDIAQRLIDVHGDCLRYAQGLGWLVWEGTHWRRDEAGRAREFAKEVVKRLRIKGAKMRDNELSKLAFRTSNDSGIRGVLNLACSDPRIRVGMEDLDSHPFLLACLLARTGR